MTQPHNSKDEAPNKQEILREYLLIDTEPEEAFDDLAALAAQGCGARAGFIALGYDERPWMKARVGLADTETMQVLGWCAQTIGACEPLALSDSDADGLKFFAGVPLVIREGWAVGVIGVADGQARALEPAQKAALQALARQAVTQLELRRNVVELAGAIGERSRAEQALSFSNARYVELFENANDIVYTHDLEEHFTSLNRAGERMTGYTREEVLKMRISDVLPAENLTKAREMMQRKLSGEPPRIYEVEILGKDGRRIALELSTRVIYRGGKPVGIQGIGRDVTERRHIEQALHAANEQLTKWVAELEQRNREGALLTKMGEMLQIAMTAEEAHAVVGQSSKELFPGHSGGLMMIDAARNLVEAAVTWGDEPGEKVFAQEECWALRGGRVHRVEDARSGPVCRHVGNVPASAICVPMMAQGEIIGMYHVQGPPMKAGSSAKDDAVARLAVTVAEHVALALSNLKLRETLKDQSIRDSLTGLFNRRFLETSMARELLRAARKKRSLGVMLLDLDHFKRFNDSLGHLAGDVLLREMGAFLQHSLRGDDIACRYGGEEFTLILPETSRETLQQRAEQICAEVRKLKFPARNNRTGGVTVSIGLAMYPEHGVTMNELLSAADAALYRAKEEGRDRVAMAVATRATETQKA